MKKALIFDLDGTLWNATKPIYKALVELQKNFNLPISSYELLCSLMGKPMDVIAEAIFPDLSFEQRKELMPSFYRRELELIRKEGGELFPHMVEVLSRLKEHYPLFIVSNCQVGYIETFLETHCLTHLFKDHLCWGKRQVHKGDNILHLMEKHGIDKAIYVGDTKGDQDAAKRAGIPYIHVNFGFGDAESPEHTINSYTELEPLVHELL